MARALMSVVLSASLLLPVHLYAQQQKETEPPPAKSDSKAQKPSQETTPPRKPSNADDNPFPEDVSQRAADAAKQGKENAPEDNTVKPKSDAPQGESSSTAHFPELKEDMEDGNKDADSLVPQHDTKRALKDDEIGKFYFDKGDWKGAYNRFKDALAVEPEDAVAAFRLAETAAKLKLTEEAMTNYKRYLELDPDGPYAKQSLKALRSLEGPGRESSRK